MIALFISNHYSNHFLLWISPVLLALMLAIPFAIMTSSNRALFRFGLFLTPEEVDPPPVLQSLEEHLDEVKDRPKLQPEIEQNFGLVQVCLDPYVNGLHVSLLRRRKNQQHSREYFRLPRPTSSSPRARTPCTRRNSRPSCMMPTA